MLQNVEIIIQDYSSVETSDLVKLFLYGTGIFEIDVNLFEKIQNYIFQTRRFVLNSNPLIIKINTHAYLLFLD